MSLKKEIDRWIKYYKEKLNLQEWDIEIEYWHKQIEGTAEDNPAAISALAPYKRARLDIRLDIFPKKAVSRIIKHELIHLLHADYDKLFWDFIESFDSDQLSEDAVRSYVNMRSNIVETLVTRLERLIK